MKIYINNKMSSIDKIEQEQVFYQGGYLTNKIRILTTEYATDWSPSLHFLLPNGRTIGPVFDSGIAEGDEFSIVENGTVYYAYDFVLSAAVLKVPGILQMTLTINYADDSGNICKRKVIGNFVNTVMKTSIDSDSNVLVVGNNKDEIIQNVIDNLETLNNKLISLMSKGEKGAANGVATLDSKKKIPVEQIPDNVMYSDNDQIITGKKKFNGGIELNDKDLEITLNEMQDEINAHKAEIDSTVAEHKAQVDDIIAEYMAYAEDSYVPKSAPSISISASDSIGLTSDDANVISTNHGTLVTVGNDYGGTQIAHLQKITARTTSNGNTFSSGASGQALLTNGNGVYWGTPKNDAYATKDELVEVLDKIGSPNGVAALDGNGKVPSSQLPSYVDDVVEGDYINTAFYKNNSLIEPESDKIYLNLNDGRIFRWSGSKYVEISSSLALGETNSTAYAGAKGKKNADDIAEIKSILPTLQNKFTAGNGISISDDGVISISLSNGDEVAY